MIGATGTNRRNNEQIFYEAMGFPIASLLYEPIKIQIDLFSICAILRPS